MANFWDQTKAFFDRTFHGRLSGVSETLTDALADGTKGDISKPAINSGVRLGMAGGMGLLGLALVQPVAWAGKKLLQGMGRLLTGFGAFKKLPLLGDGFARIEQAFDSAAERFSAFGGFIMPVLMAWAGYAMSAGKSRKFEEVVAPDQTPSRNTSPDAAMPTPKDSVELKTTKGETVAQAEVPHSPAPVAAPEVPVDVKAPPAPPPAPELVTPAPANGFEALSEPQLRHKRAEAISKGQTSLQEYFRKLMLAENQRFENRKEFIKDARDYAETARPKFVQLLQEQLGVEAPLAELMVVNAPKLRLTTYAGKDAATDHPGNDKIIDGNMPAELADFAHKFQDFYGTGRMGEKGEQEFVGKGKKFDDMLETEKAEFLEGAISHAKQRLGTISNEVVRYDGGGGCGSGYISSRLDFETHQTAWWGIIPYIASSVEKTVTLPSGVMIPLKQEYEFLAAIDQYGLKREWGWVGPNQYYGSGGGLNGTGGAFAKHQAALDEYKTLLKDAETKHGGEISKFIQHNQNMQRSFEMIAQQGIAVVDEGISKDKQRAFVEVVDVSAYDPEKKNVQEVKHLVLMGAPNADGSITATQYRLIPRDHNYQANANYTDIAWVKLEKPLEIKAAKSPADEAHPGITVTRYDNLREAIDAVKETMVEKTPEKTTEKTPEKSVSTEPVKSAATERLRYTDIADATAPKTPQSSPISAPSMSPQPSFGTFA